MRRALLIAAATTACFVAAVLAASASSPTQEQAVELPQEVADWLARDQMRRWSTFIEQGETLFNDEGSCHFCHGQDGVGGEFAPDLTDAEWVQSDGSLEGIREVIFWGVRRRDFADPNRAHQMNPEGGMDLDAEQLDALTAYVWSLNNGTFLPQR